MNSHYALCNTLGVLNYSLSKIAFSLFYNKMRLISILRKIWHYTKIEPKYNHYNDIFLLLVVLYNYVEVVALRMSRYERNTRRHAASKRVLTLFLFVIPVLAVAISFFLMDIYDGKGNIDALADEETEKSVTDFKYNYEIGSKTLYRIELKHSPGLSEAEEYIKSIKSKKLNGFILKEDGYKVIYGTFISRDQAVKIQDTIAKKAEGSISETRLQGFSLRYNEYDNAFIQLVQATDKLVWEISEAKAQLSHEIAIQSEIDTAQLLTGIESGEAKLERYLGYAEEVTVSKEQEALRDSFVLMVKEVLDQKLNDGKNYYKIQGGLMNQIEAYRRYIDRY